MTLRELTIKYAPLPHVEIPHARPQVLTPRAAADLLIPILGDEPSEVFGALLLTTKHHVLCWAAITRGSLNSTIVQPRDVFFRAVHGNAAAIIVAHNHPSGDPTPSPDDLAICERLQQAGAILGIDLIDFLVIGDGRYYSSREHGRLLAVDAGRGADR